MAIDKQREKEINLFLRNLTKYCKNTSLNGDQVYHELIYNNLPANKRVDLSAYFNYWKQIFAKDLRTQVFVDPRWDFFCQFINYDNHYGKSDLDPVKIYLTFKPEYLAEGVNQIFGFLSNNNIKHKSKIGRILRTDNIVIRVYDLNDAKKLINFINQNEFLVKGHNEVSPFCFKDGIVGLAMDNYHSYNSIICNLISKYIKYKKDLHQLDMVSCQDLCEFIRRYDIRQAFYNSDANFIKSETDLPFVEEIKSLFIKSLSSSNINDFYQHYYSVSRNKHLSNSNTKYMASNMLNDLLQAMRGTATKYDDTQVYRAVLGYLSNGNTTGFTRIDKYGNICRACIAKYDYRFVRQEIYRISLGFDVLSAEYINDLNDFKVIERLADYCYEEIYQQKSIIK